MELVPLACEDEVLTIPMVWVPMLHDKKPVGVAKPVTLETINRMLDSLLLQSDAVGFDRRSNLHMMGLKTQKMRQEKYYNAHFDISNEARSHFACADPESFVRGGPTLIIFILFYKAIIGPPAKRHLNGVPM